MNTYLKTLALACALTSFTFAGEINPSSAATGSSAPTVLPPVTVVPKSAVPPSAPVAAPATGLSLPTTPTIIDYKSIDSNGWDRDGIKEIDTDEYKTEKGYYYDYYDPTTYSMFQNRRDDAMAAFNINFDDKKIYNESKWNRSAEDIKYNAENIVLINKMYDFISYLTIELDKRKSLEQTIKNFTDNGKTFWENASKAAFEKIKQDIDEQIKNQLIERNKLNDATNEVQELTQKQQDLQTKYNTLSSENTTLQNNNSKLQTNNDSLKAANEELQAEIDRLQEENNRLTAQNNSFITQENDYKSMYGLWEKEQQKNIALTYENSKLRQEIKQKDEEISSIEQTPYIEKNDTDDEEYYDIQEEYSPTESETKTSPTPQENNTPYQQPTPSFVYDQEQFNTPTNPVSNQERLTPKPTQQPIISTQTKKPETESRPIKSRNKNRQVMGF